MSEVEDGWPCLYLVIYGRSVKREKPRREVSLKVGLGVDINTRGSSWHRGQRKETRLLVRGCMTDSVTIPKLGPGYGY